MEKNVAGDCRGAGKKVVEVEDVATVQLSLELGDFGGGTNVGCKNTNVRWEEHRCVAEVRDVTTVP